LNLRSCEISTGSQTSLCDFDIVWIPERHIS
jgi:hypothetical protein